MEPSDISWTPDTAWGTPAEISWDVGDLHVTNRTAILREGVALGSAVLPPEIYQKIP